MAKEIRDTAAMLTPLVKDVNLKHPLVSGTTCSLQTTENDSVYAFAFIDISPGCSPRIHNRLASHRPLCHPRR